MLRDGKVSLLPRTLPPSWLGGLEHLEIEIFASSESVANFTDDTALIPTPLPASFGAKISFQNTVPMREIGPPTSQYYCGADNQSF